jgi:hypothetical protein
MAGIVGSKAARASGGTVSTAGAYTVHAFTTTGANTFTPATTGFIDILLIGAGGGCGTNNPNPSPIGGGGGAGATLFKKMIPVIAGTPYPVSVGSSGTSNVTLPGTATPGGSTTFTYSGITLTAAGGGGGGNGSSGATSANGAPSLASGGGGAGGPSIVNTSGGTGPSVYGVGYPGGGNVATTLCGGGGGAGGAGSPAAPGPTRAQGGPGVPITYFTGTSTPADVVCVGGGLMTGLPTPYPTSYGNGASPATGPTTPTNPAVPGAAYIRYI